MKKKYCKFTLVLLYIHTYFIHIYEYNDTMNTVYYLKLTDKYLPIYNKLVGLAIFSVCQIMYKYSY